MVWVALLMPALLLGAVILIGTYEAAALLPQGLGFAVLGFGWAAIRQGRLRRRLGKSKTSFTQAGVAAGILAAALVGSAVLGPFLPGTGHQREVLRRYVTPPVKLPSHTSPLVGFRSFSADLDGSYYDTELLKVEGISEGYLRFAVMDYYNGITMDATAGGKGTASTGFQQMGSQIPSEVDGEPVQALITVLAGYAGNGNLSMWVPSQGIPRQIGFQGNNAATHASSLLFNISTGQGIVTDRLQEGDEIGISAVPVPTVDFEVEEQPGGSPIIGADAYNFAEAELGSLSNPEAGEWEQLVQVAQALRSDSAKDTFWSDGSKSGEEEYRPGHGQNRLLQMLSETKLIGSDEQYSVLMALAANRLSFPARVVFGAQVPSDGVIRGKNVCAWVEIQTGDNEWKALLPDQFIPPRDRVLEKPQPPTVIIGNTADVPPANPERAPSWLEVVVDPNKAILISDNPWIENLIQLALWIVRWAGPPVSLILLLVIGITGAKAIRSRRRRASGPFTTRIAGGWRELVDLSRDMGYEVPLLGTRREQSAAIGNADLRAVADAADQAIFSAGNPDSGQVAGFWALVKTAKKSMMKSLKFFKRWKARLSLRSLARAPK
jgi:hypothetical protein